MSGTTVSAQRPCAACGTSTYDQSNFPYIAADADIGALFLAEHEPWPEWMLDPELLDPRFVAAMRQLTIWCCRKHGRERAARAARTAFAAMGLVLT